MSDLINVRSIGLGLLLLGTPKPGEAQTVPTINTEDATLGDARVGADSRVHPLIAFDLRNGDYARGDFDDDAADLDRLPVHVQAGLVVELGGGGSEEATSWLLLTSSNGFHAADASETVSPRSWYESNNLVALVLTPAKRLRAAAAYTVKTSPNGVSGTTHEASLSMAYDGADAIGGLSPKLVVTARPKGDGGAYTQAGIEPTASLGAGENAPTLSLPVSVGVGWHGFYGARTGDRLFGSTGVAIEVPFDVAGTPWSARAEAVALIRDARLARLSGPDGETSTVVPLVTLSVSMSY